MDSLINSTHESHKTKAPRYSQEEWELQKTNVERLYVVENRPLKEVIQVLKQENNFAASEKQIKSRLPKWGLDVKNLKSETMVELARTKAKRAVVENKKSSFRVNKKPVDDRKIDRYLQRNDISEEQLLTMASPVDAPSPGFSVFTPQSARSSAPPSPGFNFQTLSLKDSESSSLSNLLPTVVEESTDGLETQASSKHNALSIAPHTRASLSTTDNQIMPDEMQESSSSSKLPSTGIAVNINAMDGAGNGNEHRRRHPHTPSPAVAWPTAMEEAAAAAAAKRNKERVYSKRYLRYGSTTRHEWLWTCDSCGEHAGMTFLIDHCPGCQHLRCSMCPLEVVTIRRSA